MSASTLATFTGGLTARQRANDAWNMPELPQEEVANHQRLINALRRIESTAPVVSDVPADPFDRDWQKWRKAYNTFLKEQLETIRCQK